MGFAGHGRRPTSFGRLPGESLIVGVVWSSTVRYMVRRASVKSSMLYLQGRSVGIARI